MKTNMACVLIFALGFALLCCSGCVSGSANATNGSASAKANFELGRF